MKQLKARVRRAFDQARAYDANAHVQARAALTLAEQLTAAGLSPGARVLDMGCGTGALALALTARVQALRLVLADLAPAMLVRARANLAAAPPLSEPLFAAMDAERPALRPVFDAVASCMALQWVADLPGTLARLWDLVRPGGHLAVCLPVQGTFAAWRAAHEACGLSCGLIDFPAEDELAAILPPGAKLLCEDHPMTFLRARDFPRHLKAIGAAASRPGFTPLDPARFRAVLAALDRAHPGGPVVAYRLLHALARKPA